MVGRLELGLPLERLWPPDVDAEPRDVEPVLVSHGEPLFDDAQVTLEQALAKEHRGAVWAIPQNGPAHARIAYTSLRD